MSSDEDYRDRSWWQTNVGPDKQAEVGGSMARAAIVWFAVIAVLAVVFGVVAN